MSKDVIIFDLDDVIVIPDFLKIANEMADENKVFEDLKEYYIEEGFSFSEEQRELFYDELVKRNLYENAKLVDGAYDTLKELSKNYEIFIVSASIIYRRERLSGRVFCDKFNFIINNLPFINPNNIILTGKKDLICGKYMIDDKLENLIKNNNVKYKILFTAYHNRDISSSELEKNNIIRVDNYKQLYEFITTH